MRVTGLPAALATAVALAGCGLTDPYTTRHAKTHAATRAQTTTTTTTRTVTDADPAPEQNGTIPTPARQAADRLADRAGSATPQAAIERYATLDINWTANTVAHDQRQLAQISLGQARAQALQAAASYRNDTTLHDSQVANSGQVIAIARGQGEQTGTWIVVTRESTTGQGDYQGLPPTDHVTYAQLQHNHGGWVISQWSPQN
jgi:thioesterase domain-containing protein